MHSYTTQSLLVQNTVQNPQKVMLSFCEFLDFSMSQIGPLAGPGSSLQVICLTPLLTNVSLELCYRALICFSKAFLLQCHQRHTLFDNYIVCMKNNSQILRLLDFTYLFTHPLSRESADFFYLIQ